MCRFNALQGYVGAGDFRHVPHTNGGRFVLLTSAFSILVLLTTYTALITSDMLKTASDKVTLSVILIRYIPSVL